MHMNNKFSINEIEMLDDEDIDMYLQDIMSIEKQVEYYAINDLRYKETSR